MPVGFTIPDNSCHLLTDRRYCEKKMHMDEDGILIQPPDNLDQMIESWLAYEGESGGYCFVCDSPIKRKFDIIPGTNDHRCERQKDPRS
jgi:hypothetical protein